MTRTAIGLGAALAFIGGDLPSLDLAFSNGAYDARLTPSVRTTNAMQYDSQGRLVWGPANMFKATNDLSQSSWTKTRINQSAALAAGQSPPYGTAHKIYADSTASSTHAVMQAFTQVAGQKYTIQVLAKAAEFSKFQLLFGSGGFGTASATFDLSAGSVANGGTAVGAIVDKGNGWWLCSAYAPCTTAGGTNIQFLLHNGTNTTFDGDGVSGIYVAGFQAENTGVDSPKAFVENSSNTLGYYGPRLDYNPSTLAALGLLIEEPRTNFSNGGSSNASWSATNGSIGTGATAGGITFSRITGNGTAAVQHNGQTTWTSGIAAATAHTVSCYVKRVNQDWIQLRGSTSWDNGAFTQYANFNTSTGAFGTVGAGVTSYSSQDCGNGIYRIFITFTSGAAPSAGACGIVNLVSGTASGYGESNALATSVDVWGMQVEAGACPSSPIPTYGVSATRATDAISMATAGWFAADGSGTWLVQAMAQYGSSATARRLFSIDDGTVNKGYQVLRSTSKIGQYRAAGGTFTPNTANTAADLTAFKLGGVVQSDASTRTICLNGGTVASASSAFTNSGHTTLTVGSSPSGSSTCWCGWISRLRYWPAAKSDAAIQALTS